MAPALRDEYDLSLSQIGVVLGAEWVGLVLTLLPWGLAVDRVGERWTIGLGLGACAGFLAGAAFAPGFGSLALLIALAGAAGGSVQSGSGRAVMRWFDPSERGLALGLRQTAVPVGGLVAALVLPAAIETGGVRAGLLVLAALCLLGAVLGAAFLRERVREGVEVEAMEWTLRDGRLWVLSWASGLYLVAQVAIVGFVVLYLHDERGLSTGAAAGVLGAISLLGAVFRIAGGRWSDVVGSRLRPLRTVGVAMTVTLLAAVASTVAPTALVASAFVIAGGLSMAWNGLSYTAAAELAGEVRSGAAIGFQQTVLSVIGTVVPPLFALIVVATSYEAAFALAALGPLAGWWALGRLRSSLSAAADQGRGVRGNREIPPAA